jgi:hypothetical protein
MKFIPNAVTTLAARTALRTSNASPQILFAAGVIGMGATVVLACRATLQVEETLEKAELQISEVRELHRGNPSSVDARKDKAYVYTRSVLGIAKLYAPAIVVGSLSVAALTGSHNILCRRNAALTAAYGTLQKAFDGYRDRVREAYGEDREQEIYHDVQSCEIENEKGKTVTRKIGNGGSPYARLFDDTNPNWEPTPESNWFFLRQMQEYANNRLQARGHVFLNEIYDQLGIERSTEGAVVGWIKDSDGDNYIDFGIFTDRMQERVVDFMIGRENAIWLDFNVDGVIYKNI